jgi:SAM-dependent methyltransferase
LAVTEAPFHWDVVNVRAMGRYLTEVEGVFIQRAFAQLSVPATVLDVGGGSGRFAIPLQDAGHRVVVVDPDLTPLRALARCAPDVRRVQISGKLDEMPVADASVDGVVCIEVPVMDEPIGFFAECYRLLRPGGLLVFSVHNRRSYKGLMKRLAHRGTRNAYYGEMYLNTIDEIRAHLAAARFSVIREQGFNWLPATRDTDSQMVWASARLERMLGLGRLVALSPWVMVAARRSE